MSRILHGCTIETKIDPAGCQAGGVFLLRGRRADHSTVVFGQRAIGHVGSKSPEPVLIGFAVKWVQRVIIEYGFVVQAVSASEARAIAKVEKAEGVVVP